MLLIIIYLAVKVFINSKAGTIELTLPHPKFSSSISFLLIVRLPSKQSKHPSYPTTTKSCSYYIYDKVLLPPNLAKAKAQADALGA